MSNVKSILLSILGVVLGLLIGTIVRVVVTDLVIVPFIVPLIHPSAETYGEARTISIVGALIQIAFMIVGGRIGYKAGIKQTQIQE